MPHAEVNGTRLHYADAGAGRPVMLIHGFPFDHTMWDAQVAALAGTRRCIAVDLRGFGRSARVRESVLTMEAHASDLAELVESLDLDGVDVVGLSMGGYVALAMYEIFPHLVRSLTLIDTRAGADTPEGKQGRDAAAATLVTDGREAFAAGFLELVLAPGTPSMVRARVREMIEGSSYPAMMAALAGMRDRPDRSGLLPSVTVPALVIVGELDALTPPAEAEAMAAAIPKAELVVVPGAGHMTPMERPDDVTAALAAFLA